MRADEREGELNDTEVKRAADRAKARAREILTADLAQLSDDSAFLRWFGRYAYPMMTQNFAVNNGSLLAHFMGKRELVLQVIDEMDAVSPGFLSRVLAARTTYESELRAAQEES